MIMTEIFIITEIIANKHIVTNLDKKVGLFCRAFCRNLIILEFHGPIDRSASAILEWDYRNLFLSEILI